VQKCSWFCLESLKNLGLTLIDLECEKGEGCLSIVEEKGA